MEGILQAKSALLKNQPPNVSTHKTGVSGSNPEWPTIVNNRGEVTGAKWSGGRLIQKFYLSPGIVHHCRFEFGIEVIPQQVLKHRVGIDYGNTPHAG